MIGDGFSGRLGGRNSGHPVATHPAHNVVAIAKRQDLPERHHEHRVYAGKHRWPVSDDDDSALFGFEIGKGPCKRPVALIVEVGIRLVENDE